MEFRVLGTLEVIEDGDTIIVGRARERALLALLLIHTPSPVTTDALIEALWGEHPPANPAAALQTAVSRLRGALEGPSGDRDRLVRVGTGYALAAERDTTDAHRFEAALAAARSLEPAAAADALREALAMWRGDAYADFAYEDFARPEIARLTELRLTALEDRIAADLALGKHEEVVGELRSLVASHPFREGFWEQLMLSLYRSGRQAEALRAYQQARRALGEHLGIEPGPRLRRLEESMLMQDPGLETPPLPGLRLEQLRGGLPVPIGRFVGRVEERATLVGQLSTSRLVTVTGPGGVGKTRLAVEVAHDLTDEYPDGVIGASLDELDDRRPAAAALAAVLGAPTDRSEAAERLRDVFEGRRVLLVLDGCERWNEDLAVLVADLLERCHGLSILATSRRRLGLTGESVVRLPPLSLPGGGDSGDAVALFAERARATALGFVLDEATAPAVDRIVRAVDGLPLALELAAARVAFLPVRQVAEELELGIDRLISEDPSTAARHRSLVATLEWSWALMSPRQRRLFACLSVFRAPWELEAAHALVAEPESGTPENLLESIIELANISMILPVVRAGPDTDARFSMLNPIRRFGVMQLSGQDDEATIQARHARVFADLVSRTEQRLAERGFRAWARWFRDHLPDVEAAFDWLLDHDPDAALAMALDLFWFWASTQRYAEGERRIAAALEHSSDRGRLRVQGLARLAWLHLPGMDLGVENVSFAHPMRDWRTHRRRPADASARAARSVQWLSEAIELNGATDAPIPGLGVPLGWALAGCGDLDAAEQAVGDPSDPRVPASRRALGHLLLANIAIARGDVDLAERRAAAAADLTDSGNPTSMLHVLDTQGRIARARGDSAAAYSIYERALIEYATPHHVHPAEALIHAELGFLSTRLMRPEPARSHFGRALSIGRQYGMPRINGQVRIGQALGALLRDEPEEAIEYLETAHDVYTRLGDPDGRAHVLATRGQLEDLRGNHDVAVAHHRAALAAGGSGMAEIPFAIALEGMANHRWRAGDYEGAARLLGGADAMRAVPRSTRVPWLLMEELRNDLTRRLGKRRARRLLAQGRALDRRAAFDMALTDPD